MVDVKIIVPHIYLDTNVLLDFIDAKGQRGKHAAKLIKLIQKKKWFCSTSYFSVMEVLDVIQDRAFFLREFTGGEMIKHILGKRNQRDLGTKRLEDLYAEFENKYVIPCDFINNYFLDTPGWEKAIDIKSKTNISASDCIHLTTAIEAGCDLLVTSDESFLKHAQAYIPSSKPQEVIEKLKDLKFKYIDQ